MSVSSSCVTSAPHVCQLELQVVVSCLVTDCNLSWVFSYCLAHFVLLGINVRRGLLNPIARSLCPEEWSPVLTRVVGECCLLQLSTELTRAFRQSQTLVARDPQPS